MRAADASHRIGAAVLLVIGVQDEQNVERVFENSIGFVLHLGHLEHHVEKVAGITQIVVGIIVRHPDAVPISEPRERRHLGDKPVDLVSPRFGVEDIFCVFVKSRKSANRSDQHSHRMSVVVKAIDELFDLLVDERVMGYVPRPVL